MKTVIYPKIKIDIREELCGWNCFYLWSGGFYHWSGECKLFNNRKLTYNKTLDFYRRCKKCRESKTDA